MPRKINHNTAQRIIALREQGASVRRIAADLGISPSTVQRTLNPSTAAKHRQAAKDRRAQHTESPTFDVDAWLNGLGNLPSDGAPLF